MNECIRFTSRNIKKEENILCKGRSKCNRKRNSGKRPGGQGIMDSSPDVSFLIRTSRAVIQSVGIGWEGLFSVSPLLYFIEDKLQIAALFFMVSVYFIRIFW